MITTKANTDQDDLTANKDIPIFCDWEYALKTVKDIDILLPGETRSRIKGAAAIRVLLEYGKIAYDCSTPPDSCRLAIVISPLFVRFCPSRDGLSGIFIEEYGEEKHGKCFLEIKKTNLFDFCNINARLDGWQFFANMVSLSRD